MEHMTRKQKQEWTAILDLSAHNQALKTWLDARDTAFLKGLPTDGYTQAIRKEYRSLLREIA